MGMHHTSIADDSNTQAAILFRYMRARAGQWISALELANYMESTCLSTWISTIRIQLQVDGRGTVEHEQRGKRKHYYRVVLARTGEQLEIAS